MSWIALAFLAVAFTLMAAELVRLEFFSHVRVHRRLRKVYAGAQIFLWTGAAFLLVGDWL